MGITNMNNQLKALYKELLSIQMKDGRTIYDRITPSDLCLAGHRVGRLYDGLLIYGQAMNGWQNGENLSIDALIDEIEAGASDYKELYTMVDYNGWHGYTNGKPAKYHYKRSKFWKLNYLVITNAQDTALDNFYIDQPQSEVDRTNTFDNAWSQKVAWSNLFKVSYSKGGNPDSKIKDAISEVSLEIILREIELLKPTRILFNTGENFFADTALKNENVFGVHRETGTKNIIYTGRYKDSCDVVVCRRPDEKRLHYSNNDILIEAKEILDAFNNLKQNC